MDGTSTPPHAPNSSSHRSPFPLCVPAAVRARAGLRVLPTAAATTAAAAATATATFKREGRG